MDTNHHNKFLLYLESTHRFSEEEMQKLIRDGRVSYVCQADYRLDSELDRLVKSIIEKIVSDSNLREFEI